jgi:hypothetical protein
MADALRRWRYVIVAALELPVVWGRDGPAKNAMERGGVTQETRNDDDEDERKEGNETERWR